MSLQSVKKNAKRLTSLDAMYSLQMEAVMFKNIGTQFWETVIATIQEGLMLIAPDGKIIFVNKSFEKLMGYSAEELIGKSCDVFRCDRCFQARTDGLDKYCALFKDQRVRSSQCTFRKKDGSPIHLLKNATVIRDDGGEVVGGIETLIDLSNVVARENEIAILRKQLHYDDSFHGIIGNSLAMRSVFDLVGSAAQSEAPIIIYGESGTGKEMIASAIHQNSSRKSSPFIKVNCSALNENLLESELFGHIKGSFTGAETNRIGRFEAANGGSIFLDEIGDLPLSTQTKLLRVLQEKEVERVGDHRPIKLDVRVISATNKELRKR
nr:sigma 54-interacting transcriptional regulator [Desulfobulbaceae bacterium]